jgi:Mg2+-importing ATPase
LHFTVEWAFGYEIGDEIGSLDKSHLETAQRESAALNADGFRVIAVAYKECDRAKVSMRSPTRTT